MGKTATKSNGRARRLTTVLAADICGYSHLAEMDEAAAVKTVEIIFVIFKKAVDNQRGRIFNRAGDGFFAEFPSVADALQAALAFTNELKKRNTLYPNSPNASVRAGLHVGDVIEQPNGDLLGHGVNIAARLQSEAEPNGVLASLHAVNLVRGKVDAHFRRRGPMALKNIDEPVVAFDVEAGAKMQSQWGRPFARLRTMRKSALIGVAVAFAALAANVAILINLLNRYESSEDQSNAQQIIADLEAQIVSLTDAMTQQQSSAADRLQPVVAREAAISLLKSEIPEKHDAVALIDAGKTGDAADLLYEIYLQQVSAQTPISAKLQTLKEIGALVFHADTPRALNIYEAAYKISPNDPVVLEQLGKLFQRVGDPESARAYFIALTTSPMADQTSVIAALIGIARTRMMQQEYGQAEIQLLKALESSRSVNFHAGEAMALAMLGSVSSLTEDHENAQTYREQALVIERSLADDARIGVALMALGVTASNKKEFALAADYFKEALEFAEKTGDKKVIAGTLHNLGNTYFQMHSYDLAQKNFEEALVISQAEGFANQIAQNLKMLGSVAGANGDQANACGYLGLSSKAYEATPYKPEKNMELQSLINDNRCEF